MVSADSRIYIVELEGKPIGQVRYDRTNIEQAEIDVSIAEEYRGRGYGTLALNLTKELACKDLGTAQVSGTVMTSNSASCAAFRKAGFAEKERRLVSGYECVVFIWPSTST